ncbi:MAG: type 1 glutamine amidotransferase [Bacteriovoracia bacterium]
MKTLIFQHTKDEVPGTLVDWLGQSDHAYHIHHSYSGQKFPDAAAYEALVVLGGPMNIDEESKHPWLKNEKQFVADWLKKDKAILGICLGGQMLAQVLGGRVEKNRAREIGFHEVRRTGEKHPALSRWPEKMRVFQYHEDRFTLPQGCKSLLTNEICEHQAFSLNKKTLGLQFHPESTAHWIQEAFGELAPSTEPHVQSHSECAALLPVHLPLLTSQFFHFLEDFYSGARG